MIKSRLAGLKHLVYAVSALLLLVVLGEVALRIYDSYTGQITRCDVYDQGVVRRSWVAHHELKPAESQLFFTSGSDAGITVRVNSLGVRGEEVLIPKPPGVYRVLCLGDDRTFAADVSDEETFAVQLQSLLQQFTRQKVEVINAGVPDYCPLLSFLQFKHHLAGLQADVVVVNFDMSDVADDYRYRRLTAMSPEGVPLYSTHPKLLPPPETGSSSECEMLLLLEWGKRSAAGLVTENVGNDPTENIGAASGRYAWLKDDAPDWSSYIQQSFEPITHLKRLARGMYADVMVAVGPVPWQVSATASCGEGVRDGLGVPPGTLCTNRAPFELLGAFCRQHNITFCDASPAFQADESPDTLFLRNSVGYSARGHQLYARELAMRILRNSAGIWEGVPASPSQAPRGETTTLRESPPPGR